jgi:hypothetical protein
VWLDDRRLAFATAHEVRTIHARGGDERTLWSFAPAAVSPHIAAAPGGGSLVVSLSSSPETVWGVADGAAVAQGERDSPLTE